MHPRRLRHRLTAVAIALLSCSWASLASADQRLAVVVTSRVNASDFESNQVRLAVADELQRIYRLRPIGAQAVDSALQNEGLDAQCQLQAACIARVGNLTGADHLVLLALSRIGDQLRIEGVWATADGMATKVIAPLTVDSASMRGALAEHLDGALPDSLRRPPTQKQREYGRPLWIATGVSGVGLVSALVFSVVAKRHYDDKRDDPDGADAKGTQRLLNLLADLSWASALGGGLFAGYYLFLADPDAGPESGPRAVITGDSVTFGWAGTF